MVNSDLYIVAKALVAARGANRSTDAAFALDDVIDDIVEYLVNTVGGDVSKHFYQLAQHSDS